MQLLCVLVPCSDSQLAAQVPWSPSLLDQTTVARSHT